jgi:beta-1,4-mannosyltransferase
VARGKGIRIVWTVHNLRPHEQYHPRLERYFYRFFVPRVDGFISLSHANVKPIVESHPQLRGRPHLVTPHGDYRAVYPNRVDKDTARYQLGIPSDSIVALYFGTIRAYKNVPLLIRQFRKTQDPNFLLFIVGAPSTIELEEEIVTASRDDGRIRLKLEFVRVEDVQWFFNAADFVVLPFLDSWNSGSAILALSFNRPVLVPETGSFLELRGLVGPEWVKTYRGEISPEILRQGFLWTSGAENNPEARLEGMNWESIAEKTLRFFESIGGR